MTMTDTPTPLNRLGRLLVDQPLLPLIGLLILLIAVLAVLNPGVLSMFWAGNTIKIAIPLAMLAACQTLTMLTGGIDLSVGTVATISAYLTATLAPMTGVPPAIAIALASAVVIGLVNGFGVAICRVHPLIMTLGTCADRHRLPAGLPALCHRDRGADPRFPDLARHRTQLRPAEQPCPVHPLCRAESSGRSAAAASAASSMPSARTRLRRACPASGSGRST
jgi:hypothetical protein